MLIQWHHIQLWNYYQGAGYCSIMLPDSQNLFQGPSRTAAREETYYKSLRHNQFISINKNTSESYRITIEIRNGHKEQIVERLNKRERIDQNL